MSKKVKDLMLKKKNSTHFYAEFLADIDNFLGLQNINNYVIASIEDDGYGFGSHSVGVIHLVNKVD